MLCRCPLLLSEQREAPSIRVAFDLHFLSTSKGNDIANIARDAEYCSVCVMVAEVMNFVHNRCCSTIGRNFRSWSTSCQCSSCSVSLLATAFLHLVSERVARAAVTLCGCISSSTGMSDARQQLMRPFRPAGDNMFFRAWQFHMPRMILSIPQVNTLLRIGCTPSWVMEWWRLQPLLHLPQPRLLGLCTMALVHED